MTIRNKAAIAGIGQTEFSKDSGRSTLHMALEAILQALDDAGLEPKGIDGVVKMGANDDIFEIDLARSLGLPNLRFFAEIPYGGGASCGPPCCSSLLRASAGLAAANSLSAPSLITPPPPLPPRPGATARVAAPFSFASACLWPA